MLAEFDAQDAALDVTWKRMVATGSRERELLRQIKKLDPSSVEGGHLPQIAETYPISSKTRLRLHRTIEQARRERDERRAKYEQGQQLVANLERMGNPGTPPSGQRITLP